jgi:single-strand DNA-binding protein
MNNLSITGRIGKVGELRYTQNGKAVINLSIAVDNGKDTDGEKRPATWFEVALWEKQAEALAPYLVVGDRIGVSGKIRLQIDEGTNGQKYPKLTIDFPSVELLGGASKPQSQPQPAQQRTTTNRPAANRRPAPAAAAVSDEDIPF